MQVNSDDYAALEALPEPTLPSDLDTCVLELSLTELECRAAETRAPAQSGAAVSALELSLHGAVVAGYVIYAAQVALGLLGRALAF